VFIIPVFYVGTPNGAQSGCNTKDRKNEHPITPKLIIITTAYFKSTPYMMADERSCWHKATSCNVARLFALEENLHTCLML
jgi:hypothetical protein